MSAMCTKESCRAKKGLCSHEKMMMGLMMVVAVVAIIAWAF